MDTKISLVSAFLIAILSGLVVKVVGDPLVEVAGPGVEDFFDDTFDNLGDWWDGFSDFLGDIRKD